MQDLRPHTPLKQRIRTFIEFAQKINHHSFWKRKQGRVLSSIIVNLSLIFLLLFGFQSASQSIVSPIPGLFNNNGSLQSLQKGKTGHEVFGFAPYWNFNKMNNVDFTVLTTFAYFGIPVNSDGSLDMTDPGFTAFESNQATQLFRRAHSYGTRVVLTLTQMDNSQILALMDDQNAQTSLIHDAVNLVKNRGIDGINVDFEYMGNPGTEYRNKFSGFIQNLSTQMHRQVPSSRVTVSVYASAVKDPKIYDLSAISKSSDGIFMMAYDFAVASSDNAAPTAPLYGAKTGKYWYDVSSAVNDFLTQMPADKLILGVPYYGYNYSVYKPAVNASTGWGYGTAQTYSVVKNNVTAQMSGWDRDAEVGWKAYYDPSSYSWRMIFSEDAKSLGIKYDFAKNKHLEGVGMWALGMDDGNDLWAVLQDKFGTKLADATVERRGIN